ncbi:DNA-binding protein REB1 [Pseudocercospora fuligena]|uniref:DNA-binding protein REB1 n=1 Tax=Pseudocercospora fuligena TaxID=685502 RepID=A0A8H6RHJ4_9PEZI|nr:DNA-binding protein REB1 [Pseudocercospora fuligena]
MLETSSQIDQVPRTQPDAQFARTPSPAASVHTSASRALARDLEESVYSSAKKPTTKISDTTNVAKEAATARPQRRSRAAELRDEVKRDDIKPESSRKRKSGASTVTARADQVAEKESARPRKKRKAAQETEAEAEIAPKIAYVQLPKSPAKPKQPDIPAMESKVAAPAKKRGRPSKKLKQSENVPEENGSNEPTIAEPTKAKVKKTKKAKGAEQATAGADAAENAESALEPEAGSSKLSRKRKRKVVDEQHEPPEQLGGGLQGSLNPPEALRNTSSPDAVIDDTLFQSKMAERTLTNEDMALERESSDEEISEQELQKLEARNALRLQIKKWEEEELVYAGKAKWKNGKDGDKYLKLAQPGHKFKRPALDAEQQRRAELESEARQKSILATRDALLRVLVRDELMRALPHAHIPTPPDSGKEMVETRKSQPIAQQVEEVPVENGARGTSEHVSDWLASQNEESPVPPEQTETQQGSSKKRKRKSVLRADDDEEYQLDGSSVAPESANSASTATKAARKEARRKRRESEMDTVPEEDAEDGDDDEPATARKKSKAKKKKTSKDDTGSNVGRSGSQMIKGPFSQEEKDLADGIFAEVMRQEGLSEAELVAQIKDWRSCGTFKADMFEAFPRRTKDSIRKFAERRFHGMERGAWTAEQDQALRAAHTSHPGQWSQISDIVGRTGADCRDRWRTQFQHENAVTGPWTVDEEEELLAAVEECIDAIKTGINDPGISSNRDRLEALLNWTVVAQKLQGKRTGKRCHEKYGKLKLRKAKDEAASMGLGAKSTTRVNQYTISEPGEDKKDAEKMKLARNAVTKSFEIGDYYDAFVEIHTAFKDHDRKFHDEKNVLWSIVSSKNMQSRFSVFLAPAALRRAAFEDAMEQWPGNEPKLKRKLDKAGTIPAKALVLATWVEKTCGKKLKNLTRKYRPELIGASKEELDKVKKDRRVKYESRKLSKADNSVSKDMISESDEDENPARDVEMADAAPIPADENIDENTQVVPETQEEVPEDGNDATDEAPSVSGEHQMKDSEAQSSPSGTSSASDGFPAGGPLKQETPS